MAKRRTARKYSKQERYAKRQVDTRGMTRVSLWVPEDAREQVITLAEKLRKIHKRKQAAT